MTLHSSPQAAQKLQDCLGMTNFPEQSNHYQVYPYHILYSIYYVHLGNEFGLEDFLTLSEWHFKNFRLIYYYINFVKFIA